MWPGFPWTDREVHVLGQWERTEKRHFITCGHLTAGLGLLKPQPVPRAGGKEGASHCEENLLPPSVVLNLPHEPGDGSPRLLSAASVPLVGQQQPSYLCSTQRRGEAPISGCLGSAQREAPAGFYLAGFDQTRQLWGLCLVLPGDPQ